MIREQYKKFWLIITAISRNLLNKEIGDRLPTIKEYTEAFQSSRGIVQNAIQILQDEKALAIERKGKMGTYITDLNIPVLFEMADMKFITGSMPTPLNPHLAGLATGICSSMHSCPVPFTFAFVQGAGNRVQALDRNIYDFIVVSESTAATHLEQFPDLKVIATLQESIYSTPYVLYTHHPQIQGIQPGDRVAVDPTCTDQFMLTNTLCESIDVTYVTCSYTSTRAKFMAGEVDCVIYRDEEWADNSKKFPIKAAAEAEGYLRPTILVNSKNYGLDNILLKYLKDSLIAKRQQDVVDGVMEAQFF